MKGGSMKLVDARYLSFEAVDSWFFREPRPFHADESAAGGMASVFPPPVRTLVGAVRAALARAAGWDGRGRWPAEIRALLGDGDDLGSLRFVGPLVLQGDRPVFPLPLHLLGTASAGAWSPKAILAPGEPLVCDRGTVRFPAASGNLHASGPPDGWWGTLAALETVLSGHLPDSSEIVPASALFVDEPRVGIGRDRKTRMALDHALYAARHVRPRDATRIAVGISGLTADAAWPQAAAIVPFGGEGRSAVLAPCSAPVFPRTPLRTIEGARRYSVSFLSPAFLPQAAWSPGATLSGLPGTIVSACSAEPLRIGGWSTLDRHSVPARSAVAAGSTWFFELDEKTDPALVLGLHGTHFDPDGDGRWGYGLMAIGAWSLDAVREGDPA